MSRSDGPAGAARRADGPDLLELAFDGLGAASAESGAIEGNAASARVSKKLGYADVGEGTVAPRGVPLFGLARK